MGRSISERQATFRNARRGLLCWSCISGVQRLRLGIRHTIDSGRRCRRDVSVERVFPETALREAPICATPDSI